ncbi:MAG: ABC transporter ATP-binding protein [Chloroflexi bacterium RBG_13_51_18]|nr:MAG: ABC transporter ATP-binding protein [Chloroflexi bacterium RBG_13_51_18]
MTDAAIAVNNLAFKYGALKVIDDMTMEIESGTSYGLLGPNGAGKTTLIRLMVGLLKPAGGNVLCLGKPPTRSMAKNIGYMPQLPALYSELSVEQNIDFFGRIYGLKDSKKRWERVNEVIKVVDLWEKRKTQIVNLSGGMKQRVSLACAIVHQPSLIFLDEPTVGLDPELRVHFWDYFTDLTKAGHTLIISSHTFDDAAHCQRLAFLRLGRVVAQGTPAELRAATGNKEASLEDAFLYFIKHDEVKENVQ